MSGTLTEKQAALFRRFRELLIWLDAALLHWDTTPCRGVEQYEAGGRAMWVLRRASLRAEWLPPDIYDMLALGVFTGLLRAVEHKGRLYLCGGEPEQVVDLGPVPTGEEEMLWGMDPKTVPPGVLEKLEREGKVVPMKLHS